MTEIIKNALRKLEELPVVDTLDIMDVFDSIEGPETQKIEDILLAIKDAENAFDRAVAERKKAQEEEKKLQRECEALKLYITNILDGDEFSTKKVTVKWRASTEVDIYNRSLIPEEYTVLKAPAAQIDKKAIKAALKEGKTVDGARLVDKKTVYVA